MVGKGKSVERCTFCEKSRHHVQSLISGPPGIYICNECIEICNTILKEEDRKHKGDTAPPTFVKDIVLKDKVPTPEYMVNRLGEYVIGQDRAKKVLSVAVYGHYRRLHARYHNPDLELEKSNILLVGPTGSGKTLLARTLARILDVPLAIADATTLTEAGYVGEDVENILLRLLQEANFDVERAQHDEGGPTDLEGKPLVTGQAERDRLMPYLDQKDLIDFGMIPEFVGRLPVTVAMRSLTHDEVLNVMTQPKNALVRQYKAMFELDSVQLEFTDGALSVLAAEAMKR